MSPVTSSFVAGVAVPIPTLQPLLVNKSKSPDALAGSRSKSVPSSSKIFAFWLYNRVIWEESEPMSTALPDV